MLHPTPGLAALDREFCKALPGILMMLDNLPLYKESDVPPLPQTNKPHVHAEFIKAWADGAEIEYFSHYSSNGGTEIWKPARCPNWSLKTRYRLKPEPVVETMYTGWDHTRCSCTWPNDPRLDPARNNSNRWVLGLVEITLTDGKITKAEVL